MNLEPLAKLLQDKGIGTMAKTIFVNALPAECNAGVLIRQPLTGTPIDYYLPGFYKTSLQLIVRTHDYKDGEALIKRAIKALHIETDTQLDSMFIRFMRPTTKPVSFPLSLGNFIEFTVRMDVCYNEGEE